LARCVIVFICDRGFMYYFISYRDEFGKIQTEEFEDRDTWRAAVERLKELGYSVEVWTGPQPD